MYSDFYYLHGFDLSDSLPPPWRELLWEYDDLNLIIHLYEIGMPLPTARTMIADLLAERQALNERSPPVRGFGPCSER